MPTQVPYYQRPTEWYLQRPFIASATTNTITTTYNSYDWWHGTAARGTNPYYRPITMTGGAITTNSWYPDRNNNVVWQYWVDNTAVAYTAEAVRPLIHDEQRRQQRQLASVRARALLEDFLSDEQKAELEQGFFHVVGSRGRRYRIRAAGQAGNVELLRPDGALQARLCAHPRNGLPDADAWLVQMIELRHDEDHFLRTANVHAGSLPADALVAA